MAGPVTTVQARVDSPLGELWVVSSARGLRSIHRGPQAMEEGDPHGASRAFAAYTDGRLDALDVLPVDVGGTPFQHRAWLALRSIPAGGTTTYGRLCRRLGLPVRAARAVGAAIGANPLVIVLPCHRVIGADGSLTGYAWGLPAKRILLRHEGALPPEQADLFAAAGPSAAATGGDGSSQVPAAPGSDRAPPT